MTKKFQPQTQPPRNPLVAPARFRQAGAHGKSAKAQRRAATMQLARDLRAMRRDGGARPEDLACVLRSPSLLRARHRWALRSRSVGAVAPAPTFVS